MENEPDGFRFSQDDCFQSALHHESTRLQQGYIRLNSNAAQAGSENCDDSVFLLVSAEKWCYTD